MKNSRLVLLLLLLTMSLPGNPQQKTAASPLNGKGPIGSGRAAHGPVSRNWQVAPDAGARLARYKSVRMPFDAAKLSARERQMTAKLVEAAQDLEAIFWRQNDPQALTLYQELDNSADPQDRRLRRLLFINAGRFDLLDNDQPFLGAEPIPPGRALYPPGLTREQVEAYVKAHPEQQAEIYSPYTVLRRRGNDLEALPYNVVFRPFLEPAAKALREAADLSGDPAFASFLRLRAGALLDDDFYNSDLAWLDLKDPKFDVIFAPYETYIDGVLGVKTSYGAAVLVRNERESRKLAIFQQYGPDIQDALPLPAADRPSKHGLQFPMEVMDAPFRGGDLLHGYQAVADNLPNDPRIHKAKGSKKIFFKNFLDARVNYIVLPLAQRAMRADQAKLVSADGYLAHTLLHEISHGLGPDFARVGDKQVEINEAIGPVYSGLEEAKADVLGVFGLIWLMDQGYLPASGRNGYFASYVADMFRAVRFGASEAHGKAEMMEFNYLFEQGAIVRDAATGKYAVEFSKMAPAINRLTQELLEQEATGDRARAEAWFAKYGAMPAELKALLDKQSDVPAEIAPIFSFPVQVR
jgi:hypothetical protein